MFRLEPMDIVLITLALILLFGANRIPEVMRAIGKAIREFRGAVAGDDAGSAKDAGKEEKKLDAGKTRIAS